MKVVTIISDEAMTGKELETISEESSVPVREEPLDKGKWVGRWCG
jgi:hypothetical protein